MAVDSTGIAGLDSADFDGNANVQTSSDFGHTWQQPDATYGRAWIVVSDSGKFTAGATIDDIFTYNPLTPPLSN